MFAEGLRALIAAGDQYGRSNAGQACPVNVEFVSANPTGPLHVGHGRQAALGDAISLAARGDRLAGDARVLLQRRRRADRESRAQRAGARARSSAANEVALPEGGYHGEYIRDLAQRYIDEHSSDPERRRPRRACGASPCASCARSRTAICRRSACKFDVYFLESSLYADGRVDDTVERLVAAGHTYEKDGALWLKTTDFGDDKDRVMREARRRAATYTYFVPDVAYHVTKWERGFKRAINVQGADHHSTVTRVRVGLQALDMGIPRGLSRLRAAPDGDGHARRRGGEDLEARRQLRHRARPDRRSRPRRGALLLPHAEGRLAARVRRRRRALAVG